MIDFLPYLQNLPARPDVPAAPTTPMPGGADPGMLQQLLQMLYPPPNVGVPQVQRAPEAVKPPMPAPTAPATATAPVPVPVPRPKPMAPTGGPLDIIPDKAIANTQATAGAEGTLGDALNSLRAPAEPTRNVPSTVAPPGLASIDSDLLQLLLLGAGGSQRPQQPLFLSNQLRR